MGDIKAHIFRINPQAANHTQMFAEDGASVIRDGEGRAAVSLDFVCLRCHNGMGSAPAITSMTILSNVADNIHNKSLSEVAAMSGARPTALELIGTAD